MIAVPLAAIVLLACAGSVGSGLSRTLSDSPIDLADFRIELDRLGSAVSAASLENLGVLRDRVPAAWVVRLGDREVTVPTDWIVTALDNARKAPSTWPSVRRTLVTRLSAMRAEAEGAVEGEAPGGDRARAALNDILARREFVSGRRPAWMGALRGRLSRWLQDLFVRLGGERLGRRRMAIALAWMATLAALAVLVSWLVRGLLRSTPGAGLHLASSFARRKSARAWALEAAAATDPREVARCGYHAAVRRLEEEGAWRIDEARTPREYLRLLPHGHARRTILSDLTNRFEQIWYGARHATADDARDVILRLKDLGCLRAG
jgi:uncharacterized protein DUF4129